MDHEQLVGPKAAAAALEARAQERRAKLRAEKVGFALGLECWVGTRRNCWFASMGDCSWWVLLTVKYGHRKKSLSLSWLPGAGRAVYGTKPLLRLGNLVLV